MKLLNVGNLCTGSPLASIAFCCSTEKFCPYRDRALEILHISKDDYESIKREFGYHDERLCYNDLAFCCSLEVDCPRRNAVMRDAGISAENYISMKERILRELRKVSRCESFDDLAWNEVVVYRMIGRLVITNSDRNPIYLIALGNPELSSTINIVYWEFVEESGGIVKRLKQSERKIISIRLDEELIEELDSMSERLGVPRSHVLRELLHKGLLLEKNKVKTASTGKKMKKA